MEPDQEQLLVSRNKAICFALADFFSDPDLSLAEFSARVTAIVDRQPPLVGEALRRSHYLPRSVVLTAAMDRDADAHVVLQLWARLYDAMLPDDLMGIATSAVLVVPYLHERQQNADALQLARTVWARVWQSADLPPDFKDFVWTKFGASLGERLQREPSELDLPD